MCYGNDGRIDGGRADGQKRKDDGCLGDDDGVRESLRQFREMQKHRQLAAWRNSISLAAVVYDITARFPPDERFGLTTQLRRAAVSVSANIAEGHARSGPREFCRFLSIALGSLAELDALIELSAVIGILNVDDQRRLDDMRGEASRTTFGLYRRLKAAS
jgi:four helix bundle protein